MLTEVRLEQMNVMLVEDVYIGQYTVFSLNILIYLQIFPPHCILIFLCVYKIPSFNLGFNNLI